MTFKIGIGALVLCFLLGGFGGWIITYEYYKGNPTITTKWTDETSKTHLMTESNIPQQIIIKKMITDQAKKEDWESHAKSQLNIESKQTGNKVLLTCNDDYKWASREMEIDVRYPDRHWIIMPMATGAAAWDNSTHKISTGWGAQVPVGYKWGPAGLAISPGFIKFPSRFEITASAGGVFNF
jgi:hypothetical protein